MLTNKMLIWVKIKSLDFDIWVTFITTVEKKINEVPFTQFTELVNEQILNISVNNFKNNHCQLSLNVFNNITPLS